MLRQTSNAAINVIGGRTMQHLTALLVDLKAIWSIVELALRGDRLIRHFV